MSGGLTLTAAQPRVSTASMTTSTVRSPPVKEGHPTIEEAESKGGLQAAAEVEVKYCKRISNLTNAGGGESKPASNSFPSPSRTPRPPSGGRRPGGSGGRRPGPGAPVTAEPGLVLVLPPDLPGYGGDDDLPGYGGSRPADSQYGAPGGRRG